VWQPAAVAVAVAEVSELRNGGGKNAGGVTWNVDAAGDVGDKSDAGGIVLLGDGVASVGAVDTAASALVVAFSEVVTDSSVLALEGQFEHYSTLDRLPDLVSFV
jgi:hypothetical protein